MQDLSVHYNKAEDNFVIKCDGLPDVIIKSSLGMKCLYHLINNSGRVFKAAILRNVINESVEVPSDVRREFSISTIEDQLIYQAIHHYIPASDMKTIIECRGRLRMIDAELEDAKFNNDLGKCEELISERDFIDNYIQTSMNLNGTFKNLNNIGRNATRSIQRSIRNVMNEIKRISPKLYVIIERRLTVSSSHILFSENWAVSR